MLNVADAPYQAKRTRDLLKVKKFKTVDARVTGVFEGIGALVGTLGGIHVEFDIDGKTYTSKCGSGFTFEQRDKYWAHPELLIGKIVELNVSRYRTTRTVRVRSVSQSGLTSFEQTRTKHQFIDEGTTSVVLLN